MYSINMKKLALLLSASALVGLLVVPSGASADVESARPGAGDKCDYARTEGTNVPVVDNAAGEQVIVYANADSTDDDTDQSGSGVSNDADAAAGVCVNRNDTGAAPDQRFDGGTLEAGVGDPTGGGPSGAYVIADGDNNNDDPATSDDASRGYIGVSEFETGNDENAAGCTDNDPNVENGTGTNSGGCLTIRTEETGTIAAVPGVPLLACGNDSSSGGPADSDRRWEKSKRDGCTLPQ